MFQHFNFSTFQHFNVSMFQCFNVSMFQRFNVSMFQLLSHDSRCVCTHSSCEGGENGDDNVNHPLDDSFLCFVHNGLDLDPLPAPPQGGEWLPLQGVKTLSPLPLKGESNYYCKV